MHRAVDPASTPPAPGVVPEPLREGEIHVWSRPIEPSRASADRLSTLLDPVETTRASRFFFDRDRDAFIFARGTLRLLLGRYLGQSPDRVRFAYGPYGKPSVAPESAASAIRFNISHCEGLAVFAFARSMEVGVDVERVRDLPDLDDVARRFFSDQEVSAVRQTPVGERSHAFFRCWTAKEAYIKGIGEGLSMPLNAFAVSVDPAEGHVRLTVFGSDAPYPPWRVERFEPSAGYVAAIAVQGDDFDVRFREPIGGEGLP
jgi:4'-phosphopantetheinyl transferase